MTARSFDAERASLPVVSAPRRSLQSVESGNAPLLRASWQSAEARKYAPTYFVRLLASVSRHLASVRVCDSAGAAEPRANVSSARATNGSARRVIAASS